MDTQNFNFQDPINVQSVSSDVASKAFISKVFSWMFLGLVITGLASYLFATDASLASIIYSVAPNGAVGFAPMGWVAAFAPFALVLLMGAGFNKLSYGAMAITFIVFSLLMGMSLSSIFLVYATSSIYSVFFITAAMFGLMAVLGYTTKTDLTKFGSLLMMLLLGVIIASVVNIFMHSSGMQYIISFACVAIFTGLTAYDVQKMKNIGAQVGSNGDATVGKMAVYGALSLYLDFINLFLALLRIFGNRK
jgi:FtsH-binding integral membrane protein